MFGSEDFDLLGLGGIDTDGDGLPDVQGIDLDGDGLPDVVGIDTDGDGTEDLFAMDTDGDGVADLFTQDLGDIDGDGIDDSATVYGVDDDGDGVYETYVTKIDLGGDGSVEATVIASDLDGDGMLDVFREARMEDADGDGIYESLVFSGPVEAEQVFEAVSAGSGQDSFADMIEAAQQDMSHDQMALYNASQLRNFDPSQANPQDIIGDPGEAMRHWHTQETDSSCAVAAQEFVLDQLTGHNFSESDLRDMASDYGWYGDGTAPHDFGNILVEHGLTVTRDYGNSMEDIANCLENGGGCVVGLDVYELYGVNIPGEGANHALQVIGIDQSDPGSPMVILNDSATTNGGGLMVPAEDFMAAWEDSDCLMVEAYAN